MLSFNLNKKEKEMSKESESEGMLGLALIVVNMIVYPFILLLNSFVGLKIWNWLVIPTANVYEIVVPALSFGSVLCLFFATTFFFKASYTGSINKAEIDWSKAWLKTLLFSWLTPLMTLLVAFVIKIVVY